MYVIIYVTISILTSVAASHGVVGETRYIIHSKIYSWFLPYALYDGRAITMGEQLPNITMTF